MSTHPTKSYLSYLTHAEGAAPTWNSAKGLLNEALASSTTPATAWAIVKEAMFASFLAQAAYPPGAAIHFHSP